MPAVVAAAAGGDPRAARLRGAAEAVRDRAGLVTMPSRAGLLDRFVPADAGREAELEAGRRLTAPEALTLLRSSVL